MIEIAVSVLAILLLSIDGIYAFYSMFERGKTRKKINRKNNILSLSATIDPQEELYLLKNGEYKVHFPSSVMERGGFTGRGSPFLTRNKYRTIENVDKSIERIIQR